MSATYDQEAEQIVLGSLIQNPEIFQEVSEFVKPDDFYFEQHRFIYISILEEMDQGRTPDLFILLSNLKTKNLLERVGNKSYLTQISGMGSSISAVIYSKKIKELSLRRSLLTQIKEIEKDSLDTTISLETLLSKTEKALSQIADRQTAYTVRHIRELNTEFIDYLEKVKTAKDGVTGIPSYFNSLDKITTGFKGGQLIILAARPGVGKTTFALNMAQRGALAGMPVVIFSLEMNALELLLRMICADALIESSKVQKGFISEKDMERIYKSAVKIYASQLYVDDSPTLTSWEMKQRSRRLANQLKAQGKKIGLIVVDYLQLMTEGTRSENRQVEVSNISRGLKQLAKELDVPVIALSQMNRSVEQRGKDHRPQLSDLRESGAIEQDADIVMFIHREELYNKDLPENEKGIADLIIAKHRAGPTGNIKLAFIKEKNFFNDYEEISETPDEY